MTDSKLTSAQRRELSNIRRCEHIYYGVIWYGRLPKHPDKRQSTLLLDGRICNALVRKGILIHVPGQELGDQGEYKLAEGYK